MSDPAAPKPILLRIVSIIGLIVGWAWFVAAGIGGFALLIKEGPWPLTNGWFALFSGLAGWPVTGWMIRRLTGKRVSGWLQFVLAFLIILAGRIALVVEGQGHFLPSFRN